MTSERKRVLCLSGHDPSGGAGIHADIEAVGAQGAHALSIITAMTVQDTGNVLSVTAVPAELMAAQLAALESDGPIAAIKIGLLGHVDQVRMIVDLIRRQAVPVVFDPVLRAGGGARLVDEALQQSVIEDLLSRVDLLTPNAAEARRLTGEVSTADCAARLLTSGCRNLLVTGGDESGSTVRNTWFSADVPPRHYDWPRLPETFHGAGCTLAAAIAAQLALGLPMGQAIERGQRWTQATLVKAVAVGNGRRIPFRR